MGGLSRKDFLGIVGKLFLGTFALAGVFSVSPKANADGNLSYVANHSKYHLCKR